MKEPRIALIGARRVRQGLGPFVARHLTRAGAEVVGFLGTGEAAVRAAYDELETEAGIRPPGYTDLERLLERETPDALAILSPSRHHEPYLEAALAAGLHVLCEKPLLWGRPGLASRVEELCRAYHAAGLLLVENCQWPHVLPAFWQLHPEGEQEPPHSFGMRLTPASRGAEMIGDALPHALSLLGALAPGPGARIEGLAFSTRDPECGELVLDFCYTTPERAIQARVELIRGDTLPRKAGLTINGRAARRRVRMNDSYALFLGDGKREVALPDPLEAHLVQFLSELAGVRAGRRPEFPAEILQRATLLEETLTTFQEHPPA